jgi:hypothetical protein
MGEELSAVEAILAAIGMPMVSRVSDERYERAMQITHELSDATQELTRTIRSTATDILLSNTASGERNDPK